MENNNEKICWSCQRIIEDDAKLGLCPKCANKYGEGAAVLVAAAGAAVVRYGPQIGGFLLNILRRIR